MAELTIQGRRSGRTFIQEAEIRAAIARGDTVVVMHNRIPFDATVSETGAMVYVPRKTGADVDAGA